MSESEEDYLTDESDGEKEKASGNEPIMSIFASYYGIEDTNQPEPEVMGTIDDSNFDHVSYVKNVLQHESVEGMVAKDSELVHEIRNLDGEMQKLVYDNYNKFITATETIKEMKTDVFSMDSDMISVRSTMVTIAEASRKLDGVFEEKRGEVDKLVRIRRLLDRLVGGLLSIARTCIISSRNRTKCNVLLKIGLLVGVAGEARGDDQQRPVQGGRGALQQDHQRAHEALPCALF